MATVVDAAVTTFSSLLGPGKVKSDEPTRKNFALGNLLPDCVVSPGSKEEVASALRRAAEMNLAVVPCRNGTKLDVGNPPRRYDVALSLREMNRIWHYEPKDLTVSVEAGMKLADFQRFVGRADLRLPLDPPFEAKASIGGILATNSSGRSRLHYGQARDMTIGMSVATVEGKLIKTGGRVVKNVTGYDLAKLFIGSFGTLGVITEASFKLYPVPPVRQTFRIGFRELFQVRSFRGRLAASPLAPSALEFVDERAAELALKELGFLKSPEGPELWIEVGGVDRVVTRAEKELAAMAAESGADLEKVETGRAARAWSRLREFRDWLAEAYPEAILLRAALPLQTSEEFIARSDFLVESARAQGAVFAHIGSGIVHVWLFEVSAEAVGLVQRIREAAERMDGSLVVERASAEIKAQVDVWGEVGDSLDVMRRMKSDWDPKNTLSPGRFVGGI
jgi:glycolate oxidase FAD binding subunit